MVRLTHLFFDKCQHIFRTSFQLENKTKLRWFPGHMGRGVKDMQKRLKSVDCVVEVHDARIPFSGRNPDSFQTVSGLRPHILVYNKRDLADESLENDVIQKYQANGFENVVFTNCKDPKCHGVRKVIPMVQKLIKSSQRYNRSENNDSCLMIIGVPNVGKSSLINVLRSKYLLRRSAANVGAAPGITRAVGEKIKISDDPLIYVMDTPGILSPKISSVDDGMKLAVCNTIPDKEVGVELVADYLLFWLNKNGHFKYIDYFGVENPSDNITELLASFAVSNNLMLKGTSSDGKWIYRPNINRAAMGFVEAFRRGLFGRITLDEDKLDVTLPGKEKLILHTKRK